MSPIHAVLPHRSAAMLAAALTLTACSPDVAIAPEAPSASSGAGRSGAAVGEANRAVHLPFHGSLEARETLTFAPAPPPAATTMHVDLAGSGTATHLGRFALEYDATVTVATGAGYGSMTFTAANGDLLRATWTGVGIITNGIAAVTEEATITGGTGRFAGATGSFVSRRSVVMATGVSTGSFDGTITLAR